MKNNKKKTGTIKFSSHPDIASAVIREIGINNIICSKEKFYIWNQDKGVWEIQDSLRDIKLLILDYAENATSYVIESVVKIIGLKTERNDVNWNSSNAVNCKNGEIYISDSGIELRPHNRESYFTFQIPVNFNPNSKSERFNSFLDEIFVNDTDREDKKQFILEFIGYSLQSNVKLEKMLILVGQGANGKSTLLNIVQSLCGQDNTAAVQPSEFGNKFQRAFLANKLVNIISELEVGKKLAEGKLKAIISGERTTVEEKYKSPHNIETYATCWIGTNHLPPLKDFTDGFFRRIEIIEFNEQFKKSDCDVDLKSKLLDELEGILVLALNAYSKVINNNGFTEVESSRKCISEWREDADQVKFFFEDNLTLDLDSKIGSSELYKNYREWSFCNGINRPLNITNFIGKVCRLGGRKYRVASKRFIRGIKLKNVIEQDDSLELETVEGKKLLDEILFA